MQTEEHALKKGHSGLHRSLRLVAAAACLWPAIAAAADWNPTSSDGLNNTAGGQGTLSQRTTGGSNTGFGANVLVINKTGRSNTGVGSFVLNNNNGDYNTAIGDNAMEFNATGVKALFSTTKGNGNVAVGYNALTALTSGSNNIALGTGAGNTLKTGSNNIYVGASSVTTETNVTRIGKTQTKVFIKGIAGVHVSGASVVINSAGQLGVVSSSARYKQDIRPLGDLSERLSQLRPVSFSYKTEPDATHYGLIAEEVDKVMPELVVRDEENRPESVQYQELIPLLLQERDEMRAELDRQRALIEQQSEAIAELRHTLDTRLAAIEAPAAVASAP
jgi:hypothetical protein